jgi:hypothetical protein
MNFNLQFALYLFCASIAGAQAPSDSCCRLSAMPDTDNPAMLKVAVTNLAASLVTVHEMAAEVSIRARVTAENGKDADLTPYGKRLLTKERGGSMILRQLKRGESVTQNLDLRALFELKPGNYNVALSRDVIVGDVRTTLQTRVAIKLP